MNQYYKQQHKTKTSHIRGGFLLHDVHAMRVRFWKSTTDHIDEFLHVFDITHELIMTFFLRGFGMELVLREERVDELPIRTIRDIDTSDRTEF